jgi:nitrous oxidase accessory protein NosD
MKHKIFIFALLAVALVLGCNRETPQEPQQNEEDIATVIQNLREYSQNPAVGLDKIAKGKKTVKIPAGSVDALAAAIAEVRDGGVVLLRSGQHTESGTVTVDHRVKILGEPGAILISDTKPGAGLPATVDPAFHVLGASQAVIWGLDIRFKDPVGGTAILIENSPRTLVGENTMRDCQFGVLIEKGDRANICENTIITTSAWQTGELLAVYGIVSINGERVEIEENDVSNAFFGIWVCDKNGELEQNKLHGNYIGLIFCRAAESDFILPSGNPAPAKSSATGWSAEGNNAFGNDDAGYLVIDGANHNVLENNNGSNNGTYDIDLTGDTYRFGYLTPKSFNNKVVAGRFQNVKIKNCGENNTVVGGQLVDNTQDPCY